jgi:type IV secretion system protein VirD4
MYLLSRLLLLLAALLHATILVLAVVLAGLVFGPPAAIGATVLLGAVLAYKKGRRALTACGTAAWAGPDELGPRMLHARTGLILGRIPDPRRRYDLKALLNPGLRSEAACQDFLDALTGRRRKHGRLVRLPQAVHTAVFAPTRCGKGVSLIVPWLLSCDESAVCVDFKGELATLTAAARRAMGHRIVILDPFRLVTQSRKLRQRSDTLNPIDFIAKDDELALDECRDLAEAMVIRTGEEKDPHWCDSAEAVIAGLIATVVLYGNQADGTRSLQAVRDILANPKRWEIAKQIMQETGGMLARWGGQLEHFRGDELSSVLTTSNRFLRFLDTAPVVHSTTSSSFNPADLRRRGKMTAYLVLPPEHARAQSPLLRTWLGCLFRAHLRGGLKETPRVHYILDEAAALGHMQQLDDAVDKYAGYGVRLQFYYQSLGQLKRCWPSDQGQTLLSNTTKIFFGTNDFQTAEFLSKSLGNETIIIESGGRTSGTSQQTGSSSGGSYSQSTSTTTSRGGSSNWAQQTRELLKPDEITNLPPRTAITLTPGLRPLWTTLLRYYEEPRLFRPRRWWRRLAAAGKTLLVATLHVALAGTAVAALASILATTIQNQQATPYPTAGQSLRLDPVAPPAPPVFNPYAGRPIRIPAPQP